MRANLPKKEQEHTDSQNLDAARLKRENFERIADIFKLFADPTRLMILQTLKEKGELNVSALFDSLSTSQANISKHLNFLRQKGLISRRKVGTRSFYKLREDFVIDICKLVCTHVSKRDHSFAANFEDGVIF